MIKLKLIFWWCLGIPTFLLFPRSRLNKFLTDKWFYYWIKIRGYNTKVKIRKWSEIKGEDKNE